MQFSGSAMFRTVTVLAISVGLAACAQQPLKQASSHPPVMTQAAQSSISPDQALQLLKEGNARFVSGNTLAHDWQRQVKITGKNGQYPFVSIVSCIDSRAAPAQVFDLGVGDAFSARVAGNIVNEDILGSLEYGSKVAGTKLIVILGHTSCGAVKGACDNVAMGNLTGLLAKIRPAVDATPDRYGADRSSHNHPFVDAVAEKNVHLTVQSLLNKSPVLSDMVARNEIKVVGAMLDVKTGEVVFY
jgi:carbonic anhydrase